MSTTIPPVGGSIRISEKAVSKILAAATAIVPGTTSLARLAGRSYPRFDVAIDHQRHRVAIEAVIAVSWPSPVTHIAEHVRTTITSWVRAFTGYEVSHANIIVAAIEPGARRVERNDIDAAPEQPEIIPIQVKSTDLTRRIIRPYSRATATNQELRPIRVTHLAPCIPIVVPKPQPLRPIYQSGGPGRG